MDGVVVDDDIVFDVRDLQVPKYAEHYIEFYSCSFQVQLGPPTCLDIEYKPFTCEIAGRQTGTGSVSRPGIEGGSRGTNKEGGTVREARADHPQEI